MVAGRKEHWAWEVERVVKQNTQYTGKCGEKRLRNGNHNPGTHMVVEYYCYYYYYPFFLVVLLHGFS